MSHSREVLDFGMYRGMSLDDVPIDYVLFLAGYRLIGVNKEPCTSPASYWVERHLPIVRRRAVLFLRNKCWSCGGFMQPIGNSRANGRCHDDWYGRVLHKRCWKDIMDEYDSDA